MIIIVKHRILYVYISALIRGPLHLEGCIHPFIITLVDDGAVFFWGGRTFCFYSFTAFIVKNKHLLIDLDL